MLGQNRHEHFCRAYLPASPLAISVQKTGEQQRRPVPLPHRQRVRTLPELLELNLALPDRLFPTSRPTWAAEHVHPCISVVCGPGSVVAPPKPSAARKTHADRALKCSHLPCHWARRSRRRLTLAHACPPGLSLLLFQALTQSGNTDLDSIRGEDTYRQAHILTTSPMLAIVRIHFIAWVKLSGGTASGQA
jgi:hypothetical protein